MKLALQLFALLMIASCQIPEFEFESTAYDGPDSPSPGGRCDSAIACVSSAELSSDSNNDGKLNPGESAAIEVSVVNNLARRLEGISGRLSSVPAGITVTRCMNGSYQSCQGLCQCSRNAQNWLDPQESTRVLMFDVKLSASVELAPVKFGVELSADDRSWQDAFELDVVATGARVAVGSARIVEDDNGDGKLSPGEAVTIELRPKNVGTAQANGVFAVLTSVPEGAVIRYCYAATYVSCHGQCQCPANSGISRLMSFEEAASPVLRVTVQLSAKAALLPIEFGVRFQDETQATWDDTFEIDVVPTGAKIGVESVSASDENGDGVLSAGETGSVAVFAENTGTSSANVFAKLTRVPAGVTVANCYSATYSHCPGQCACTAQTGTINLAPGAKAQRQSLTFDLTIVEAVPPELEFGVSFEDDIGNKWPSTFNVATR